MEREKSKKFALPKKKLFQGPLKSVFRPFLSTDTSLYLNSFAIFSSDSSTLPALIVIGGPTASGKTDLAIRLAKHFDTEIISADSRQFYRDMTIGTAKPDAADLASVKHHFIDTLGVADDFSVGDFERNALEVLADLYQTKRVAIVVGGSGLFISALCEGLDRFPDVSAEVKSRVETAVAAEGLPWLQSTLQRLDPDYYEQVDRQNPARLRRAVEVCLGSGQPYSAFLNHTKKTRPFRPLYVLLELPRPELYVRIDARVEQMIAAGLEAEARSLLPWRHRTALRTVGYEEWFDCFDGHTDRKTAVEKIKQHTRNYAKRQITWFKKYGQWTAFHPADWEGIKKFCERGVKGASV